MKNFYIGLLSGTSMDAIDAALVDFSGKSPTLLATHSELIPDALKFNLTALGQPGMDEITLMGQTDVALGKLFATAANNLLKKAGKTAGEIKAIGSHGQNIRHQPNLDLPFTLQIGDPNIIAELTGITTVGDFRRRDIACGGQGAPLTPAFHDYLFRDSKIDRTVVNIGGISNLTILPADQNQAVIGFDSGPGNTLIDVWTQHILQKDYDKDGSWAASGDIDKNLLAQLLADPYFQQKPPKSKGREYIKLSKYIGVANL